MNRELATIESSRERLKNALGDNYDMAIHLCYDILQVKCRMQEQSFPPNTFVSGLNGETYILTSTGFVRKSEYVSLLSPKACKIEKPKRGFWGIFKKEKYKL